MSVFETLKSTVICYNIREKGKKEREKDMGWNRSGAVSSVYILI